MEVKKKVQDEILRAISSIGTSGATISQIEKKVKFERHTLSKYLSFMQGHGLIYHNVFGKAKVWFINKVPLQTVLQSMPEQKTFVEKVLYDLISHVPCGVMMIDRDYNIQFMNPRLTDVYGESIGEKFYEVVLGLENPLKVKKIAKVIYGQQESAEIEVVDAFDRFLRIQASRFINPDSSLSVVLMIEDITESKKAQEEIYAQKSLLEAERETLNKSAIVAETDLEGCITYVNDKFVSISGYSRKELIGQTHQIINSGHHPSTFFKKMWRTISSGKVWSGLIKNKRKDGTYYWVESAIAPVIGKDGKPVKFIAVRFDVTTLMDITQS